MIAEGKPIKAIAAARRLPAEAVDAEVEAVFVKLADGVSAGTEGAICSAFAYCTERSSIARSKARRSHACCRAAWPRSSAETAGASARPSGSR